MTENILTLERDERKGAFPRLGGGAPFLRKSAGQDGDGKFQKALESRGDFVYN
ncbi:hypothetical protein [Acutalibacter sp.]|jgi:hypothetical protein|uniref:hypothetical protein n=1 Tax=Acutalibacter sp. TaxID=1918636 RepID=UPI0034DF2B6C